MCKYVFSFCLFLLSLNSFAQSDSLNSFVVYATSSFKIAEVDDEVKYEVVLTKLEDERWRGAFYTLENKYLLYEYAFMDSLLEKKEGVYVHYNLNGSIYETGSYKNNLKVGEWKYYNVFGDSLKAKSSFESDSLLHCYFFNGEDSVLTSQKEVLLSPTYKGGVNDFFKFIMNNFVIDALTYAEGVNGAVYVKFLVDEFGGVNKLEVLRGVNDRLDAEAIRVISLSSGNWNPGIDFNRKVKTWYTVPIKIKTDPPSKKRKKY